jgi:hypothetical protein
MLFVIFQTMLVRVGSEITLGETVVDLAVFGHLVITLELLQLAIERNGMLGSLGKLCMMFHIAKVSCIFYLPKDNVKKRNVYVNRMVFICFEHDLRV